MNLWVSAPSSIRNPTIQIMIPKIYKAPRFSSAELVYFWLRNSKTSPAVNVTHRPCKHQDVKNLIVLFLIFTNLLSCPVLITLQNRKLPSLTAHISTKAAAIFCFNTNSYALYIEKRMQEMYVKLPVKSQNFQVESIFAGMKAMNWIKCMASTIIQKVGMSLQSLVQFANTDVYTKANAIDMDDIARQLGMPNCLQIIIYYQQKNMW